MIRLVLGVLRGEQLFGYDRTRMTDAPNSADVRQQWFGAAFIVAATFLAYLPAINGSFLWQDDVHITNNSLLRDLHGLKLIWTRFDATPQYYPLTYTTFWLEYQLWNANPAGYHIVNVLLHASGALLLWWILSMVRFRAAWMAAAIFALHPVHVESVAWISGRKNVLCGLFYFLAAAALLKALRRRRMNRGWYALGAAAFVAALLSKAVAGTLPLAVLLVLWWKHGRIARRQLLWLLPMILLAVAMGRLSATMEHSGLGAVGPEWNYTFPQRVLMAGQAVWFYAGKLIAPARLTFVYPKWDIDVHDPVQWLYPAAALAVVVLLALSRKRLGRGPLGAVLYFICTLFPVLGFINIYPMRYSLVADHFQYLASIGLIAWGSAVLWRYRKWAIAIPALLLVLTMVRASDFRDPATLWQDTLEKNPQAWIAHDQLGTMLTQEGKLDEAARHFEAAVRLEPKHIEGYLGMGNLLLKLNRPQAALEYFRRAVEARPEKLQANMALANALLTGGDVPGAIQFYEQAVSLSPKFVPARLRLANAYQIIGQQEQADEQMQIARRLQQEIFGYDAAPEGAAK